mgnify:CR=1 FL=1
MTRSILLLTCLAMSTVTFAEEPWPLAVRIHSYGDYQDAGYAYLEEIGVKYIFIAAPMPDEVETTMARLREHNLTPLVVRGDAALSEESFAQDLAPQLAAAEEMGVKYKFVSAKRGESSKETAYERLRAAGDIAKEHGVTITLETHPDLGTNGAVQVETMRAVNHPNIRVNFDTANVTYYNHDTSAVDELKKSIGYVHTVEFKDHSGGFETWDFPVVGQGIVDFPTIVEMLRRKAYQGPVTIEFEGTKGVELNEAETKQAIADSVAYVRTLSDFE